MQNKMYVSGKPAPPKEWLALSPASNQPQESFNYETRLEKKKKKERKEKEKVSWKTRLLLHSSSISLLQRAPARLTLNINVSLKHDLEFSKDRDYSKIMQPFGPAEED